MRVEIYPLEKVVLGKVTIFLGMERGRVEEILGNGQCIRDRYYYFENEMAIEYDESERVEFIEFLGGIDGRLKPMIYGMSVFESTSVEIVERLRRENGDGEEFSDQDYAFGFADISVGVWRELRPTDVGEMIEEMKADGMSVENNEEIAAEMRKANHWATIGMGVLGCYNG